MPGAAALENIRMIQIRRGAGGREVAGLHSFVPVPPCGAAKFHQFCIPLLFPFILSSIGLPQWGQISVGEEGVISSFEANNSHILTSNAFAISVKVG